MRAKDGVALHTVSDYLAAQSPAARKILSQLRAIIKKNAPKVVEGISYGMPVYRLEGILVYMGAFKNHCSLFAMPSAVLKFQKELKNYTTSKGTIQFTLQDSLPKELVARIIQYRVKENQAKAARKKKS
jgi:uncharacterized protein YdhG (YjbR/CyaY superfamily)